MIFSMVVYQLIDDENVGFSFDFTDISKMFTELNIFPLVLID